MTIPSLLVPSDIPDDTETRLADGRAERRQRRWIVLAIAVAGVAVVSRVYSAFVWEPLADFDGYGHAANVLALHRGNLPDPASWSGFHPPLYFALGAWVWDLAPRGLPLHVLLRLLSIAAGIGIAILLWRGLRRIVPSGHAAVVTVAVFCAPVLAIASTMLGNEALCAFFVTGALVRLAALPTESARRPRHAIVTGIWLALATLTKATGLVAGGVSAIYYAWSSRHDPRRAIRAALFAGGIPVLCSLPHVARLADAGGSLLAAFSGSVLSRDARALMDSQPPAERRLGDYFLLPSATLLGPWLDAEGMARSVPGLLYATAWADGHNQYLPGYHPSVRRATIVLSFAGLLPMALAALGVLRLLREPGLARRHAGPLCFAVILGASFLRYTWVMRANSAVKASYLLSAAFPAAIALTLGVEAVGRAAPWARALLLVHGLVASVLLFHGWWG